MQYLCVMFCSILCDVLQYLCDDLQYFCVMFCSMCVMFCSICVCFGLPDFTACVVNQNGDLNFCFVVNIK